MIPLDKLDTYAEMNDLCPAPSKDGWCVKGWSDINSHLFIVQHGDNPEARIEFDIYLQTRNDWGLDAWIDQVHNYLRDGLGSKVQHDTDL